jgi:hypothetical protein
MRVADRARALARGREPWIVLVPLLAAQWVAVAAFASTVRRNGWLFYQGGDQTWFYTSSWVLAHGQIPESLVGYLWPFLLVPVTLLAGPNLLDGLPAILVFQVGVLLPLGLLSVYVVAAKLGGRLLGYLAAGAWIAAPFLAIPLFVDRYHERWTELTLPQALGLTGLGDFPSMVLLTVAAVFVLRTLERGDRSDAVAAGLVVGLAVGLKPANGLFVFAPVVALALARRPRAIAEFGLALLPALVTLTLWKYRGSGISVLALEQAVLAAEAPPHPSELSWLERARQYVPLDAHQLNQQFLGFREYFWSARLLEWVPVAGAIAVARRSVPAAAFFSVWLAAFFVVKGSSPAVNVETASIWRLLMPAWPAYFFLAISIPLLLPVLGPRLAQRFAVAPRELRWPRFALPAALGLLAVPLVLTALLPASKGELAAKLPLQTLYVPIELDFGLTVSPVEGGLDLRWSELPPATADSFYVVYRSPLRYTLSPADPRTIEQGRLCEPSFGGAPRCTIEMEEVARTRERAYIDRPPGSGEWTYRIAIAANWRDDPALGDALEISKPLNVSVG